MSRTSFDFGASLSRNSANRAGSNTGGLGGATKTGTTGTTAELRTWESVKSIDQAYGVIHRLERELAQTLASAESEAVARDKSQSELETLRRVAEDVNTENDMIVNDMQDLYKENDSLHESLKQSEQENAELEEEVMKLKQKCEDLQERIEACQVQAVDPEEVHEAVKQLRASGNLKLKEAGKERQSMEEMVDQMRTELNDARERMLQIVTEKDEMMRKTKAMQKKLKRCSCSGEGAAGNGGATPDERKWRSPLRKSLSPSLAATAASSTGVTPVDPPLRSVSFDGAGSGSNDLNAQMRGMCLEKGAQMYITEEDTNGSEES